MGSNEGDSAAERDRLTTAIEQVAETVEITDAQGLIVYVNPAFETITGYTRAEALGRNPNIVKSGLHEADFYREMWETISSGKTWHGRMVNRKKDGTLYTEEATISPVRDAAGVITSYVAVKRDISRELALEAQLLQAQKMEGIGRLAGGVAHDFNNLLSVILSYVGFAAKDLPEGQLKSDLLEVKKAGDRAAQLTGQLLAFSRKQISRPERLDLNELLSEMERMLSPLIGEDVELVRRLAPGLGVVKADPGHLEQVIMNLVVNARDAMPEGGKLTLETANVDLAAEYVVSHAVVPPGAYVRLAVTDSGVGMSSETMERLFEPFYTTKDVGKGTGLGLSTVYGIVKQAGGSIVVGSVPGQGSTFQIYLPRQPAAPPIAAVPPATVAKPSTGVETILVVEDEAALRAVIRRLLEASGYTVLLAGNGEEALRVAAEHKGDIDLLLTDVVMPRMNGKQVAEELCRRRPSLNVLYMSGYTGNVISQQGTLDEKTAFLAKPFSEIELTRMVRKTLDGAEPSR
jgi:PAS domain S-box-containing protein